MRLRLLAQPQAAFRTHGMETLHRCPDTALFVSPNALNGQHWPPRYLTDSVNEVRVSILQEQFTLGALAQITALHDTAPPLTTSVAFVIIQLIIRMISRGVVAA